MKNSILWGLAGLILGVIGSNYYKSTFLILSGTTKKDIQKEILILERRDVPGETNSIATSILARAVRQVSLENPELKELVGKERFLDYIKTQHSKKISEIQTEFDSLKNHRFDRLSIQELNQYKEFLGSSFLKKMSENSAGSGLETKNFFDRQTEQMQKLVLEEAKAVKN